MTHHIFTYPLVVKKEHLDVFGHVNNAVYLTLFEEARWDLMKKGGYDLKKIQETKLGPIILEVNARFLKELKAGDKITIRTQLITYEKKIAQLKQEMLRDEVVCCEATFTFGLFDLSERRLVSPTDLWLAVVGYTQTK